MGRFDKHIALGKVEALLRRDQPDLRLSATTHYGEDGFAYVLPFKVDPEKADDVLARAKKELAARGFPVEPILGKDVMHVRPIPPEDGR